jgi:hypothetical protein
MERCADQLADVLCQAGREGRAVNIHSELGNMTLDGG